MRVLVFDIDGTLTETNHVDGKLFEAAILSAFPTAEVDSLEAFAEFTDTGILREVWEQHGEGEYEALEAEVQAHFFAGLRKASRSDPVAFSPVLGAREIFSKVVKVGWTPAVATGAWRQSAELKLAVAGIPIEGVPLATSSERIRRVDIIRLAVAQVSDSVRPEEIVYVGDGIWDVRACRELGIGFVGRITPGSEPRLSAEGARAVIQDFGEPEHLFELLADPRAHRPSGCLSCGTR